MAKDAKAKEASCWEDRIMVTGAVIIHKTWDRKKGKRVKNKNYTQASDYWFAISLLDRARLSLLHVCHAS